MSGPAALPWDVDAVTQAALDILRLDPADVDADRIAGCAASATEMVDMYLDYETAPAEIPNPVFDAGVTLTVEGYRRKDAPFGKTDSWAVDGAMAILSTDPMRSVETTLAPYKARWGVA